MKRLFIGLVVLGVAGTAAAQLGSSNNSPACCQLTTSLIQDVVYGRDAASDERFLTEEGPPSNLHILIDTSSSMQDLPQVREANLEEFFSSTTNGCMNPMLDAFQYSRGWNPYMVYPVPDQGTGMGGDYGFSNLFRDSAFYDYRSWHSSNSPAYSWANREMACQSTVPGWSTTQTAEYERCLQCLSTKGYFKPQNADPYAVPNSGFVFWGRFLNFNPPKYVTLRVALKQLFRTMKPKRLGLSHFSATAPTYSVHLRPLSPSCTQVLGDPTYFDSVRANSINSINGLVFNANSSPARALLNTGYYFTSTDDVYRNVFGFSSGYTYPSTYRNAALSSSSRSVCWGCQDSAVILISDGEPSPDSLSSQVATRLRALNAGPVYCPDALPCGPGPFNQRDKGLNPSPTATADDNPNYLLDDVAKLLWEQDLQRSSPPVIGDFNTQGKQSLRVHTIGFGTQSNLLRNTAAVGGGQFYSVDDGMNLLQALRELSNTTGTRMRTTTLTPASVDRQLVNGQAGVLLSRLKPSSKPGPWQGFLYRFQLAPERLLGCNPLHPPTGGDLNHDGDCDDSHLLDADGEPVIESDQGGFVKLYSSTTPARPFWEAGARLKPDPGLTNRWQTRRIFTIVDTNGDGRIDRKDDPVEFTESNAELLLDYLGISQNPEGCAELATRLGEMLSPLECAKHLIRWYRGADALNPDPFLRGYDRPFLLHDIFHSTPISVEPPRTKSSCGTSTQCLPALFSGQTELEGDYAPPPGPTDAYERYVYETRGRDKIVLVGSNGGMLHAFHNGTATSVDPSTGQTLHNPGTGEELWAFIPPDMLPKLYPQLDKHAYFVDGTPMVRDVWIDGAGGSFDDGRKQWQEFRTVAVVGSGRGGVHRFALDLTRLLGAAPGNASSSLPLQRGDFLWMWPQACDPLAVQVGESFSNFAPQPPPIGPVALAPPADDALRALSDQPAYGAATPWLIDGTPARERWVVALNGGYDPHQTRGRGMALVDIASGHTVWSFFHQDGKGRSEHLRYSIAAGLALADVGSAQAQGPDADHLLDTATVGDYGGQLWTVRFHRPGQWDYATQQVSNWYAARAFRVANLAGRTTHPEALTGPFSTVAANMIQPDTGALRTFIGTGDSQNLLDVGRSCRLGNPRACAEQGCFASSRLQVQRGGMTLAESKTTYSDYALTSSSTLPGQAGPSCLGSQVKLSWDFDMAASACAPPYDGAVEAVCDGNMSTWSCRTLTNDWQTVSSSQQVPLAPQRFYGLWSYGGAPGRTFDTESEAYQFDWQLFTDSALVNVGQFDFDGKVVQPQADAPPHARGWYLTYASTQERTGSAPTVIDGCVLWNSFEPNAAPIVCGNPGRNAARVYQADAVSGRASCALGFYSPDSGYWARFFPFGTHANLGTPAPQHLELNGEVHTHATFATPHGTAPWYGLGSPVYSRPVREGPP
jgi:type IV pilus assembly protein PilY1